MFCFPESRCPAGRQGTVSGIRFFQVLLRGGQHQLDSVQLVHFTGTGIIIHGGNVCLGLGFFQHLHDAFSHNMIGKTGKRLDADDVGRAGGNELYHFTGQEPALTVLIAQ